MRKVNFLGMDFDDQSLDEWLRLLENAGSTQNFDYIVTPNVDHIVNYNEKSFPTEAYDTARFRICDSRILSKLAKLKGFSLQAIPGSDLVRELLSSPNIEKLKITAFGPNVDDFSILTSLYPNLDLTHIPAPSSLKRETPAWEDAISALHQDSFDILICCVSFPKQELICYDLKCSGHQHGIAICAGASLDFLTGRQRRAPRMWQKFHFEWLYRLLSDPRRLLKRYAKGLKVFTLLKM